MVQLLIVVNGSAKKKADKEKVGAFVVLDIQHVKCHVEHHTTLTLEII